MDASGVKIVKLIPCLRWEKFLESLSKNPDDHKQPTTLWQRECHECKHTIAVFSDALAERDPVLETRFVCEECAGVPEDTGQPCDAERAIDRSQ